MNETTAAIRDIQAVAQDLYTLAQLKTELCKKEFQDKQTILRLTIHDARHGEHSHAQLDPDRIGGDGHLLGRACGSVARMAFLVSTVVGLSLGGLLVASGAVLMGGESGRSNR